MRRRKKWAELDFRGEREWSDCHRVAPRKMAEVLSPLQLLPLLLQRMMIEKWKAFDPSVDLGLRDMD